MLENLGQFTAALR